jgi:hypothetical protein
MSGALNCCCLVDTDRGSTKVVALCHIRRALLLLGSQQTTQTLFHHWAPHGEMQRADGPTCIFDIGVGCSSDFCSGARFSCCIGDWLLSCAVSIAITMHGFRANSVPTLRHHPDIRRFGKRAAPSLAQFMRASFTPTTCSFHGVFSKPADFILV